MNLIVTYIAIGVYTVSIFSTAFPCPAEDKSWVAFYMDFREKVLSEDRDGLVAMQAEEFEFQVGYGESISVINYLDKGGWQELKVLVKIGKVEGSSSERILRMGEFSARFTYIDGRWLWSSYQPESSFRLLD